MLISDKSVFVHIARTGGHWVQFSMAVAGIDYQKTKFPDDMTASSHDVADMTGSGKFVFTFVRDPVAWLRSYWGYVKHQKFDSNADLDNLCKDVDLETFGERLVEELPGAASKVFNETIAKAGIPIYVGRTERLQQHLELFLDMAGEKFDRQVIRTFPHVNRQAETVPHFSPALQEKIRATEPWFYQTFPTLDPIKFTEKATWQPT